MEDKIDLIEVIILNIAARDFGNLFQEIRNYIQKLLSLWATRLRKETMIS